MKTLKGIFLFTLGALLTAKYVIDRQRQENQEHKFVLDKLNKSGKEFQKLIENEKIDEKGIRFIRHPQSEQFTETEKRTIWIWTAGPDKKIAVALKKDGTMFPLDKKERLLTLAHELSHIEIGVFSDICKHKHEDCLSLELQAYAGAIKRCKNVGVLFSESFWHKKILHTQDRCENCLKIINKGKCPKKERQKIKKSLELSYQMTKK